MKMFTWETNGSSNGKSKLPDIVLEYSPDIGPSDGNSRKYQRPPANYEDQSWHLGWTDGRLGQPTGTNEAVLLAQARVERQEEIRTVRRQIAAAQARIEALKISLESARKKVVYAETYYQALWERRGKNSSGSSLPLGLMYVMFGLALFLADMPLSLQLVADGFKIPTSKTLDSGVTVSVDMIFSDWQLVITNLAEPLFLALGIALMGIVVKFFVDAVILREEDDPPQTKTNKVGMYAAFALFVGSTIYLGLFRSEIMKSHSGGLIDYEVSTFIFLTLTFPIAGGLCFSAGWRRLERAKHYYLTLWRLRRLERRYEVIAVDYNEQAEFAKSLKDLLEHDSDDLASSLANLRRNIYLHGYHRGQNVPETLDAGETLYGICERTLKRALARKARYSLQQIP